MENIIKFLEADNAWGKFIKFLEANNALENFEREFTKSGRDMEYYKAKCEKWNSGELGEAFIWEDSKEGHRYWAVLNAKWREESKSLK